MNYPLPPQTANRASNAEMLYSSRRTVTLYDLYTSNPQVLGARFVDESIRCLSTAKAIARLETQLLKDVTDDYYRSTDEEMSKSVKPSPSQVAKEYTQPRAAFTHHGRHLEKPMKWMFSLLILMAGSVAFAGEAGSQESVPTPPETVTAGRSANDVVIVLAKHLSLTEDQKSKILPIIIERQRKIQEVWTSSTLFVRQKQVQVRGINKDSDRRINALLTGDQQKAYSALEQERKVQRRMRQALSEQTTN